MGQVDVKDLANEKLPLSKFPADPRADFRLHMAPEVRRGILEHAKADTSVEICGVLVGNWQADENGPFVAITDYVRCDNASSKFAEVTFTHESWAQINKEMDSRFANSRIVGWYHSHPDFGIFLSDRDSFIHEHFFSGAGQVAYVVDPVRDLEGMFAWRNGKPTTVPHFWVGNNIRTLEASERHVPAETGSRESAPSATSRSQSPASPVSSFGFVSTVMGAMLLFLLGFIYGGWRSRWEQQMIVDGAVAHFANAKVLRPGLETNVAQVRERIKLLTDEFAKLPQPAAELTKEQSDDVATRLKVLHDNLILCDAKLADIEKAYGYSEEERRGLAWFIAQQQAELERLADAAAQGKTDEPSKTQPAADKPSAAQPSATQPNAAGKDKESPALAPEKAAPANEPAQPKK